MIPNPFFALNNFQNLRHKSCWLSSNFLRGLTSFLGGVIELRTVEDIWEGGVKRCKQARKGFQPISESEFFGNFSKIFFWEFLGDFGDFFGNSLRIVWGCIVDLGFFWEFFRNFIGILSEFYWNSLGISNCKCWHKVVNVTWNDANFDWRGDKDKDNKSNP